MRGWYWLLICTSELIQILRLLLISARHHPNSVALSWLLLNTGICSDRSNVHDRVLRFHILIVDVGSWKSWLGPHRNPLVKSTAAELISLLGLDIISSFWRLILIYLILVIHCSAHVLLVVLLTDLLHRIYLPLILHHLGPSKIITLIAHISYKLFLTVVAPEVQRPVAGYKICGIILIWKCNLRCRWLRVIDIITIKSLLVFIRDSFALSGGVDKVLSSIFLLFLANFVIRVSVTVTYNHFSFILFNNLHSIVDVYIVVLASLIQLLQYRSNIINSTQSLQERNIVVQLCVLLFIVPRYDWQSVIGLEQVRSWWVVNNQNVF